MVPRGILGVPGGPENQLFQARDDSFIPRRALPDRPRAPKFQKVGKIRLQRACRKKGRKWGQFQVILYGSICTGHFVRVILYQSYIWRLKTAHRKLSLLTVINVSKPRVKYDKNERCWSVNSIMRSRLQKFAWFHRRETLSNVKFNLISPQIETGPPLFP